MSNQSGLYCPDCWSPDELMIYAKVSPQFEGEFGSYRTWITLCVNGASYEGPIGDSEWMPNSPAKCDKCGWEGRVKKLIDEEDMTRLSNEAAGRLLNAGYLTDEAGDLLEKVALQAWRYDEDAKEDGPYSLSKDLYNEIWEFVNQDA